MPMDCTRLRLHPWLVLFTACRHTLGRYELLDGALDLVAGDQVQLCPLLALWLLANYFSSPRGGCVTVLSTSLSCGEVQVRMMIENRRPL